jgi:hypothetical protein
MPESTGHPAPATIPHTAAEESALRKLFDHCQDTDDSPACTVCRTPEPGECEEGTRLRRAVSHATTSRTQGVQS